MSEKENTSSAATAILATLDHLKEHNPQIAQTLIDELKSQRASLKLIASENYCSLATQLAMGNWLTDKYAEGKAGHRFYAGCENVDTIEYTATEELKKLFGCDHAYVQPASGADANFLAFSAILYQRVQIPEMERLGKKTLDSLSPEEFEGLRQKLNNQKMLGMSLNAGGHLTHGYRFNFSSKMFQAYTYDVNPETLLIDYEAIAKQARELKPLILLAGYSSYPRALNFAKLRAIADEVGATLMVDMAHFAGLVAGKVFAGENDPIPYADVVTSTTHKTLRGPRGGIILCKQEFATSIDKGCPLTMGGPMPHVMAAKAVSFQEANRPEFATYAKQIVKNAKALAERLKFHGLSLVTGGTDNHLVILDVTNLGITGRQAETALSQSHITVNRNAIPFDPNGPWFTSGIRLGTPALTTLGMKEQEMEQVADWIVEVLKNTKPVPPSKEEIVLDTRVQQKVTKEIKALLQAFPLYPDLIL